ncbi:uncharacterized protein LOC122651085 [Telopea speciosissima]|uniref:uncharacterized protein LOC122651085 n=1 Tax=Telopea speciosissima TaxID=54955 RepID=UPI001CC411B8|nr:uncharacterized protein LOC122651085 [Telopea speciosissima]
MAAYLAIAKELVSSFYVFEMQRVSRNENEKADVLSRLSTEALARLDGSVYIKNLAEPSHQVKEVVSIEMEPSWMDPIVAYLRDDILPEDRVEARKVRGHTARYTLVEGELYKRSVSSPLLRCLTPSRALYTLAEVHKGICGSHMGGRHLAYKVLQLGFYWPNMQKQAIQYVKTCEQCQKFASIPCQPATELASVLSPIPFAMWGMDVLGNFTPASGGRKYLVVAVDYFTKWVEAEPLARITRQQMEKSVSYPQANGQAEVTNHTLLAGIKRRLTEAKARWVDELPSVLWSYQTTVRTPTGESPFRLTYGTEALAPVEILAGSLRSLSFNERIYQDGLRANLDFLDEIREDALLRNVAYQ